MLVVVIICIIMLSVIILIARLGECISRAVSTHPSGRVAIISAVYGGYDNPATHVTQSIPVDFYFFTDVTVDAPGYVVDQRKYHYALRSQMDTKELNNSYELNNHTFNQAKFYKQQFYRIPCLQNYDYIVWIDGSIELTCTHALIG